MELESVSLDRNFLTHDLIIKLNDSCIPYIINMKSNTFGHQSMVDSYGNLIKWNPEYSICDGKYAGISDTRQIFKDHPEKGFINLYYDYENADARQRKYFLKINNEYDRLKKDIANGNTPKVNENFKEYFSINEKDDSKIEIVVHHENIVNSVSKIGFGSLLSKVDYGIEETNERYHKRDVSEKQYMIVKSQLGYETTRVYSTTAIYNKMFCCFISTILRNEIENACKELKINTNRTICEIDRISCIRLSDNTYKLVDDFSEKQKKFLDYFSIDQNYYSSLLDFTNTRNKYKDSSVITPLPSVKQKIFTSENNDASASEEPAKSKGQVGRPKGSKNKKTLEREAELRAQGIDPDAPKSKGQVGRPKGSKNKKTLEREAELRAQGIDSDAPKPTGQRGRPKGSKNKKTLEREEELRAQGIDPDAPKLKGQRGRPKGSKNKKTLEREAELRSEY